MSTVSPRKLERSKIRKSISKILDIFVKEEDIGFKKYFLYWKYFNKKWFKSLRNSGS